jgi:ParB family chromosome partitioning protein
MEATGLKIEVEDKGKAGGRVVIHYKTLEQLDDLCQRLRRGN